MVSEHWTVRYFPVGADAIGRRQYGEVGTICATCGTVAKVPPLHYDSCHVDTAQHTLELCPAWAEERQNLGYVMIHDDELAVVCTMVTVKGHGKRLWPSVKQYCSRRESRSSRALSQPAVEELGKKGECMPFYNTES